MPNIPDMIFTVAGRGFVQGLLPERHLSFGAAGFESLETGSSYSDVEILEFLLEKARKDGEQIGHLDSMPHHTGINTS